ncbi:MAG: lipid-binding SYLF domain-containing protein [Acidobacteria bacterium]|nr:lipid-binding SYLF domain-containing protein [Acidobacteriota bacterium]
MKFSIRRIITATALCAFVVATQSFAAQEQTQTERQRRAVVPTRNASQKQQKEASKKASNASRVLDQIMDTPERSIPKELLAKAEAVAVFPGVLKAGLGIGGRGGSGLISRRITGGWSVPVFFKMGGLSIGPQIGASKTDFVLLFMNEDALKGLLEDKLEIGGEASAAAGPVGRAASATTNLTLDAGILSYSRSKGLFAGLELKGAVVNPDNNLNEAIYGMKARDLLTGSNKIKMADVPTGVIIFPNTLARYSIK